VAGVRAFIVPQVVTSAKAVRWKHRPMRSGRATSA
jgi:hypothetical protein